MSLSHLLPVCTLWSASVTVSGCLSTVQASQVYFKTPKSSQKNYEVKAHHLAKAIQQYWSSNMCTHTHILQYQRRECGLSFQNIIFLHFPTRKVHRLKHIKSIVNIKHVAKCVLYGCLEYRHKGLPWRPLPSQLSDLNCHTDVPNLVPSHKAVASLKHEQ